MVSSSGGRLETASVWRRGLFRSPASVFHIVRSITRYAETTLYQRQHVVGKRDLAGAGETADRLFWDRNYVDICQITRDNVSIGELSV